MLGSSYWQYSLIYHSLQLDLLLHAVMCSSDFLVLFCVTNIIRKLDEDEKGGIFSVTLFKRAVCEFKAKALESK